MAHDNEEQEIGTSTEEAALAAFQLHEESDECRDRNKGKPETPVKLRHAVVCAVMLDKDAICNLESLLWISEPCVGDRCVINILTGFHAMPTRRCNADLSIPTQLPVPLSMTPS